MSGNKIHPVIQSSMEEGDIILCLVFFIFVIFCEMLTCIHVKFHSSILFINKNILTYLNLTIVISASLVIHFQVIFTEFGLIEVCIPEENGFCRPEIWVSYYTLGQIVLNILRIRCVRSTILNGKLGVIGFVTNTTFAEAGLHGPVRSGKSAKKKPRGISNPGMAKMVEGPLSSTSNIK